MFIKNKMNSSCISHPEREKLVMIRQWQMEFCEGNSCAAALMSFFEYWHNIKLDQSEKNTQFNNVAELHGDKRSQDEGLWQFHNEKQLEEGILIYKKDTINKAIDLLVSKQVLLVSRNPNPRYKFDKTRWFLFRPEIIKNWMKERTNPENSPSSKNPSSSSKNPSRSEENQSRCLENPSPSLKNPSPSPKNPLAITETSSETTSEITTEITSELREEFVSHSLDATSSLPPAAISIIPEEPTQTSFIALEVELSEPNIEKQLQPNTNTNTNTSEEKKPLNRQQALIAAFASLLKLNLLIYRGGAARLGKEIKLFSENGINAEDVTKFSEYWYSEDFRGQKGEPPTLEQVSQKWDTAMEWHQAKSKIIVQQPHQLTTMSAPRYQPQTKLINNKAIQTQTIIDDVFDAIERKI
ncbi:MAG: hypothetical protein WAQ98_21445 [Blastocatellia bacterium]